MDETAIIGWLLSHECRQLNAPQLVEQLAVRLRSAGLAVQRVTLGVSTMHPEVLSTRVVWTLGEGAWQREQPHDILGRPAYLDNPVAAIDRQGGGHIRVPLTVPRDEIPFPLCRELKDEGYTDYLIVRLPLSSSRGTVVTFSVKEPAGLSSDQLALLLRLVPALSLRVELASAYDATRSLLRTYLGANAALHVLDGAFRLGGGTAIRAVVWICDLRGFTSMVDRLPVDQVLRGLTEYFSCVAEPVVAQGGEILKYIGDAVLGVFPWDGDHAQSACAQALRSADAAFARQRSVNQQRAARGEQPLRFGIALHLGEVVYGNIGTRGRLDFTVIGRTVNETARMEAMCKALGAPLLLSERFAAAYSGEPLVSLGRHALRGVGGEPPELFTLARLAPDA